MNTPETETDKPPLPECITVRELSRWIDWTDPKQPQFRFTLEIVNGRERMTAPYGGGILAFQGEYDKRIADKKRVGNAALRKEQTEMKTAASRPVRTLWDEQQHNLAVTHLFSKSKITPADVLHSMLMDSQAGAESFADFCGNYGFNEDSRKAFGVYEQCQRLGKDFRRVIGPLMSQVEAALEDY